MRRLAITREKQRINFEDKLYVAKVNKVVETAMRNITNSKTFVISPFNGSRLLTSFINDLIAETMARK